LSELGISHNQSHRWQAAAAVPEKKLAGMDCGLSTRTIVQEELVHGIKLTLKVFDLV